MSNIWERIALMLILAGLVAALMFRHLMRLTHHEAGDNQLPLYSIHPTMLYFFHWAVVTTKTIRHLK
jgi:hypothetical protein